MAKEQNAPVTIKDPSAPASFGQRGYIGGLLIDAAYAKGMDKGQASRIIQDLAEGTPDQRRSALTAFAGLLTRAAE